MTCLGCAFVADKVDIFLMGALGDLFQFFESRRIFQNIFSETSLRIAIANFRGGGNDRKR